MTNDTEKTNLSRPITNSSSGGATKQAGQLYVSSVGSFSYDSRVTAKDIHELSDNMFVDGPITQTKNLVMSTNVDIWVFDGKNDRIEEAEQKLRVMFSQPECNLTAVARSSLSTIMQWGIALYNWYWVYEGNELVCKEITALQPYNFRNPPQGSSNKIKYGKILKGILFNPDDRKTHYYETPDQGQAVEIQTEDIFVVKEPMTPTPDGKSVILPLVELLKLLNYSFNTFGQQMFRLGAPLIFIKITDPQPERIINGVVESSDEDYAKDVLANWGKDTAFTLRSNFEVIDYEVKEGSLAVVGIKTTTDSMSNYWSPSGMLGKDGSLISGNSDASLTLFNNYIDGWCSLIEQSLNVVPNYYLKHNNYDPSWRAEVHITRNVVKDKQLKLEQAKVGAAYKVLTPNEVREKIDAEAISDEELAATMESWNILNPPQQTSSSGFSSFFAANNVPPKNTESDAPSRNTNKVKKQIAQELEGNLEIATDDLEEGILKIMRRVVSK